VRRRPRDLLFVATDRPGDGERRRAASRGVVALAGAAFFLSLACAFTMPILFGVDERVHLAYVEVLLSGELPEVDQDVPLDGRFPVLREYYAAGTEEAGPRGDVWVANHPPLTYVLAALPTWLAAEAGLDRGPPMVLRVLNGLGMALGVIAVAAACDALLPGRRLEAMAAAGLAAFAPSVVSIASYGYNDGVAFAVGTALLAVILRVARFGPTPHRLLALVALGTAAVLARSSLLPLVAIAGGVWLVRSWRSGAGRSLAQTALVGGVPAVLGGWFYLRNVDLYGSVTGSGYLQDKFQRVAAGSTADVLADPVFLLGVWQDLWASFRSNVGIGSGHIVPGTPDAVLGSRLVIGGALVVASLVGAVRALLRPRGRRAWGALTWIVAAGWVGVCALGLASFASGGGSSHPRYLFPALGVLVPAMVAGLARLPRPRVVLASVVLAFVAVDALLFVRLRDAVHVQPFPDVFDQPSASTVVVAGVLAVMVGCLAWSAQAWRDLGDEPAV
jgi:hypothetical protein